MGKTKQVSDLPIKEILAVILTTACSALEQGFDRGQEVTLAVC